MRMPHFSLDGEVNRSSINRPHFAAEWMSDTKYLISLSWGNGNSDPVWVLYLVVTLGGEKS